MNVPRGILLLSLWLPSAGAQTVTPSSAFSQPELRRIVERLAHDSALGRPTPSRALESAAEYVAGQFRGAGLQAFGDERTFFSRYPVIESVLDEDSARIELGNLDTLRFGSDFWYAAGGGGDPSGVLRGPLVIITGAVSQEASAALGVSGKIVLFISPLTETGRPTDVRSAFALMGAGARGVIVPGGRPDTLWRRIGADPDEHKPSTEAGWPIPTAGPSDGSVRFRPVLELWSGRFSRFLRQTQLDSASLHSADGTPKVTQVAVDASLIFARRTERVSWPANVVGVIPGSDPLLRSEYVVVTAHLDGLGQSRGRPPGPASILNGADDNASGVAAMIQMARAIASAPRRPKRSVIFAAVSGEEKDLWGSDWLASRWPLRIVNIVANVNLDMVGRSRADTVYLSGRSDSVLTPILRRVLSGGGNRRLTVLDQAALDRRYPGEALEGRSDHASFTRRGVPAVWLFTGLHADYHETTDDAERLNYDALARIARLAHDIAIAVADAPGLARQPSP